MDGLRIREAPGIGSSVLAELSAGQVINATGRLQLAGGLTWVEVLQLPSGRSGWVAGADYDGTPWLAAVHDGLIAVISDSDVALADALTGRRTPITDGMRVTDLAFSPSGTQVAILDVVQGPAVISTTAVTFPSPSGAGYASVALRDPVFAPNGQAVAYLVGQDYLAPTLMWLGADEAPALPHISTLLPVSWSTDSRWLGAAENFGSGDNDNWETVLLKLGSDHKTRLTNSLRYNGAPVWSPDGLTIASNQDAEDGSGTIGLMDADGANQRRLFTFAPSAPYDVGPLEWSPDGAALSILVGHDEGPAEIYLIDSRTPELASTMAAPDAHCEDLTWSPEGLRIAVVCWPADYSAPSVYVVTIESRDVVDLGPGTAIDWGRTLEPLAVE